MTTPQDFIVLIVRMVFTWAVLVVCVVFSVPWYIELLSVGSTFLIGYVGGSTYASWVSMGRLAMSLADQAAQSDIDEGSAVQIAEGVARFLPPRQMFACAIAQPGHSIIMYRGIKMWSIKPLTRPEDSKTGMLCWKYRSLVKGET